MEVEDSMDPEKIKVTRTETGQTLDSCLQQASDR